MDDGGVPSQLSKLLDLFSLRFQVGNLADSLRFFYFIPLPYEILLTF